MTQSSVNNVHRNLHYLSKRTPLLNGRPSAYRRQLMKRNGWLRSGSPIWPVLLLLLVLSVTGCATSLPPPVQPCPTLPARPSVSTPQPSTPYLDSVQIDLKAWREMLKATPLTP